MRAWGNDSKMTRALALPLSLVLFLSERSKTDYSRQTSLWNEAESHLNPLFTVKSGTLCVFSHSAKWSCSHYGLILNRRWAFFFLGCHFSITMWKLQLFQHNYSLIWKHLFTGRLTDCWDEPDWNKPFVILFDLFWFKTRPKVARKAQTHTHTHTSTYGSVLFPYCRHGSFL